jgi:hypothetical protein
MFEHPAGAVQLSKPDPFMIQRLSAWHLIAPVALPTNDIPRYGSGPRTTLWVFQLNLSPTLRTLPNFWLTWMRLLSLHYLMPAPSLGFMHQSLHNHALSCDLVYRRRWWSVCLMRGVGMWMLLQVCCSKPTRLVGILAMMKGQWCSWIFGIAKCAMYWFVSAASKRMS